MTTTNYLSSDAATRLSQALESFTSEVLRVSAVNDVTEQMSDFQSIIDETVNSSDYEEGVAAPEEVIQAEPEVVYPNYGEVIPSVNELPAVPVPENSGSILIQESTSRFSGAVWYEKIQEKDIVLAGIGGIGSWVAFLLSRMHPRHLILYDDDIIEVANMSGQFYSGSNVGQYKVNATVSTLANFSNYYSASSYRRKFTEDSIPAKIMICGFDNMQARRTFYNSWKVYISSLSNVEKEECLFIDGRLAAEEFQVFCLTGTDAFNMERYEREWLFSDEEADTTVCSYKQTTYMANMIGSIIVNLFTNFCANQADPIIPRDLPFFTSYDASLMYFKTEV